VPPARPAILPPLGLRVAALRRCGSRPWAATGSWTGTRSSGAWILPACSGGKKHACGPASGNRKTHRPAADPDVPLSAESSIGERCRRANRHWPEHSYGAI
jgi:hypothetical protein